MLLRLGHKPFATTARKLQSVRTLALTPASDKVLTSALDELGSMLPGIAKPVVEATPTPAQATPPAQATRLDPSTMVIPPAEDPLLQYLTATVQKHGHRAKAARITSRTLLHLHAFTRSPPLPVLREAILTASPAVRSMIHRQGAKNVAKPVALGEKQRTRFALQWILDASEKRNGRTIEERLARELIAVIQGTSEALKKKEEVHRFAMVNRSVILFLSCLAGFWFRHD